MAMHKDLFFSLKRNFKIVLSPHSVLKLKKGEGTRSCTSASLETAERRLLSINRVREVCHSTANPHVSSMAVSSFSYNFS